MVLAETRLLHATQTGVRLRKKHTNDGGLNENLCCTKVFCEAFILHRLVEVKVS